MVVEAPRNPVAMAVRCRDMAVDKALAVVVVLQDKADNRAGKALVAVVPHIEAAAADSLQVEDSWLAVLAAVLLVLGPDRRGELPGPGSRCPQPEPENRLHLPEKDSPLLQEMDSPLLQPVMDKPSHPLQGLSPAIQSQIVLAVDQLFLARSPV
jgi:hypothetical protein